MHLYLAARDDKDDRVTGGSSRRSGSHGRHHQKTTDDGKLFVPKTKEDTEKNRGHDKKLDKDLKAGDERIAKLKREEGKKES